MFIVILIVHMTAGLSPPDEGKNLNSRSDRSPQQKRGPEGSATRPPSVVQWWSAIKRFGKESPSLTASAVADGRHSPYYAIFSKLCISLCKNIIFTIKSNKTSFLLPFGIGKLIKHLTTDYYHHVCHINSFYEIRATLFTTDNIGLYSIIT